MKVKEAKRTERLLRLVLNAWEKMTGNQRERFNDLLYRLVVKRGGAA